ncbi:MAG TPA: PDZ domain-containing protein [Acidimicrobiales bacterium]|nr:PDZ domain-containing protein [Acidimicrobiales bacterium]
MGWLKSAFRIVGRRRRSVPPPPSERGWVHPSELPRFDDLRSAPERVPSRLARLIASAMVIALLIGGAGLASTHSSTPPNQPMTAHIAASLAGVPAYARPAARATVDLTITTPGHVAHVAAMALRHNLAVTTTPIERNALLTGSIPHHINFPVTWVGRDNAMGFTIVKLSVDVPASSIAPLPAATSVMAISPLVTSSVDPPRFAWATTTLGDPKLRGNDLISYLATASVQNLNGFADAIAVNSAGRVVAVLSSGHLWYSALFVERVATIEATQHGCHSSLFVVGSNAQGGGALISVVTPHGPASGHLIPGDVLTSINGHTVETWSALVTMLYLTPADTPARLSFVRDGKAHHTVVEVGCSPKLVP